MKVATECELHRTIGLISHFTQKHLLRVLISRTQFGFVPDKDTGNAIFTFSMLMERCIEVQKDLFICFIDYSKAFDKVRHDELFKILEGLEIDGKDLRIIGLKENSVNINKLKGVLDRDVFCHQNFLISTVKQLSGL